MTDVIQQLRSEHSSMAKLLAALERQVAVFRDGGSPDYEIMEAVVDYFLDYPDKCHHPKEDLVARKMLESAVDEAGPLQKLVDQHENLAELARRFASFVRRVLDEAELPRDDFVRSANEFIAAQRHHMEMEEEHFFPIAEGALSRGDLADLDSKLFGTEDPLLDPRAEARFAALRDEILKWEKAGRAE